MFTVANSILQGLNYLKEQQIIHLNLKAQHLLVVMTNNLPYLKICDFGMAQKFPFKRGKRGSAHFMAPETIRSYWCSNEYWYKNDVWSFGITLMG